MNSVKRFPGSGCESLLQGVSVVQHGRLIENLGLVNAKCRDHHLLLW